MNPDAIPPSPPPMQLPRLSTTASLQRPKNQRLTTNLDMLLSMQEQKQQQQPPSPPLQSPLPPLPSRKSAMPTAMLSNVLLAAAALGSKKERRGSFSGHSANSSERGGGGGILADIPETMVNLACGNGQCAAAADPVLDALASLGEVCFGPFFESVRREPGLVER